MTSIFLSRRTFFAGVAASVSAVGNAQSNGLPAGPIRILLPFSAGGGPDLNARMLANQLTRLTGVAAAVDNRSGANGIIASQAVATATPNGNMLLYTTGSHAINPSIYKKLPYDTVLDFAPISLVAVAPSLVLVVAPNFPAHSFTEFLQMARIQGDRISFGSPGVGNTLHLVGELLNVRAKLRMLHVPYKGASIALNATMSGEVSATFLSTTAAVMAVRAGQVRPLAVTSIKRLPALPDIPTIAECGFSGLDYDGGWSGLLAPAKTPAATVNRLSNEINRILTLPDVKEQFEQSGSTAMGSTPAEFGRFIQTQIKKFASIVMETNVPLQGT